MCGVIIVQGRAGVSLNFEGRWWIVGNWEVYFWFARDPGVSGIDLHELAYQH
jgi:hypothetical protein